MTQAESFSLDGRLYSVRGALIRRGAGFCLMLIIALVLRPEYLIHWDALDYAAQAIRAHSSDLLLGRWWFIAFMRAAYVAGRELFGLTRLEGYLAMQLACSLFMAGAVAAGMALTYRLTKSVTAEVGFAVLIVSGPLFGSMASAVMTEGAALCMLSLSFLAWERAIAARRKAIGWALASGLAFGVMVSMREPGIVLGFWPLVSCLTDKPKRRWALLSAGAGGMVITLGFGVLMAAWWFPWPEITYWENISRWIGSMQAERDQFGFSIWNQLVTLGSYLYRASPVIAIFALPAVLWSGAKRPRAFWLLLATAPYMITLVANHDLNVNGRLIMPAVWMLCPVIAAATATVIARLRAKRWVLVGVTCGAIALAAPLLVFGWKGEVISNRRYDRQRGLAFNAFLNMPRDAVVIPGPSTPVLYYLGRLGVTDFDVIASGWAWNGADKLRQRVAEALHEGKAVYANLNADDWQGTRPNPEWIQVRELADQCELDETTWPMVRLVSFTVEPATKPAAQ